MDARLPAHLEVSGIIRSVQAQGGFATVLAKGERDAGTILILTLEKGENGSLYERMPQLGGRQANFGPRQLKHAIRSQPASELANRPIE